MLTLRYNEPVFILMLRGRVGCLTLLNTSGWKTLSSVQRYKAMSNGTPLQTFQERRLLSSTGPKQPIKGGNKNLRNVRESSPIDMALYPR